jgi:integrase
MIANIYKPRRHADGKIEVARLWRGRYRLNGDMRITEVALGSADKQVAQKRLAEIVAEKERERAGIIAPRLERDSAAQPIAKHLEDFMADLHTLGRTPDYINKIVARIRHVAASCRWQLPADITADSFIGWRSQQPKLGPKTLNEYLNALNSMLNWMDRNGRISTNPLRKVTKVDVRGHQQKRRAFTDEELERLIAVSPKRSVLYLTAAFTGLRIGELAQLIWADVKLDREQPRLIVRAATTKNRHEAIVPLHPKLAEEFKRLASASPAPESAVFAECANADRFIRIDLEAAEIERIDASGRKLDFHALRYTFATRLAVQGVSQRLAQELMRHSDPRLTANIYTDASKLPTYAAVSSLSWISSKEEAETEKDTAAKSNLPPQLAPQKPDFRGQNEAETVANAESSITPQTARIGAGRAVIDKPCRAFSNGGEGGIRRWPAVQPTN